MWDKYHNLQAKKISDLAAAQIKELLRSNSPQFARGRLYHYIEWIPIESTFDFWKSEVQAHLAEPGQSIYLEDFPSEYAYRASLWELDGRQIIFLEMNH